MKKNKKKFMFLILLVIIILFCLYGAHWLYQEIYKSAPAAPVSAPTSASQETKNIDKEPNNNSLTEQTVLPNSDYQEDDKKTIETLIEEQQPIEAPIEVPVEATIEAPVEVPVEPPVKALEIPQTGPTFSTMTEEERQDIIETLRQDAIKAALASGQNQQTAESFGAFAVQIATQAVKRKVQIEVLP